MEKIEGKTEMYYDKETGKKIIKKAEPLYDKDGVNLENAAKYVQELRDIFAFKPVNEYDKLLHGQMFSYFLKRRYYSEHDFLKQLLSNAQFDENGHFNFKEKDFAYLLEYPWPALPGDEELEILQ